MLTGNYHGAASLSSLKVTGHAESRLIIIIIKKVKIIVTLSIKNTAGALYKPAVLTSCGQSTTCVLVL